MEASIKAFRGGTSVLFAGPGLDAPEHREKTIVTLDRPARRAVHVDHVD
jgi:hypothetical protein